MEKKSKLLSILSLILGVFGLLSTGLIFSIASVVLGIVAIKKKQPKGMAITGIICSCVSFVVFILLGLFASFVIDDKNFDAEQHETIVSGVEYVEQEDDIEIVSDWASEYSPINDFRYDIDGNSITLIRYKGEDTQIMLSPVYTIDGKDYNLISMGDDACFLSETHITSVIIPEGVEEIGGSCFNSCASLERIYLPSTLKEIPSTFFGYLGEYKVFCDSQISLPSERDTNDYELLIDDTTQSGELGESMARALNGMLGGFNSSDEDLEKVIEIYFGGTNEQWSNLTNN